jgi:hypothetical protein
MAASPSTTRARRADARLLHHVLDAPPQFGVPPQKKILVAGGLTRQPAQDRWHSFVGDLKPGWDGSDYAEPGIAFAGPAERIDRLAEAIAVLKAAFSGERFSFTGQHYQVRGHAAGPVPAQRPHPPLMIGAAGPRLLGLAARDADIVTLCPGPGPTAAG